MNGGTQTPITLDKGKRSWALKKPPQKTLAVSLVKQKEILDARQEIRLLDHDRLNRSLIEHGKVFLQL